MPETLLDLVYDKLAAPSPYAGNATPWLARSIEADGDDGRSWRIALRDGIRWHDGVPFSAADVAFTFRLYRDAPATRWSHHVATRRGWSASTRSTGCRCASPASDPARSSTASPPPICDAAGALWAGDPAAPL